MRSALAFALVLASVFSTAAAAADDGRLRTVVMGISARRGIDDKPLMAALSSVVLGIYAKDPSRIVIGPDDINRPLEWEASKQQAGCDDSACLAEVAAAMDAARIVSGTVDAIGSVYLVSLAEIDAKSLEPTGRVQAEFPKEEAALLDGTRGLAAELLKRSGSALTSGGTGGAFTGNAGSIDITSDPLGADIIVSNNVVGKTPTRIDNIVPGRHTVRLTRQDYETVEFEVPVHSGGTTVAKAELRLMRAIAEQNIEVRNARWRDDNQMNTLVGWGKIAAGSVGALAGTGVVLGALAGGDRASDIGPVAGIVVGAVGVGAVVWGSTDLLNPPERPIPEWEQERKVTITPPKDKGEMEVKVLQQGRAPTAER